MRITTSLLFRFFFTVIFLAVIDSCANRGLGPTGGPKDLTPPKVLKVTPPDKATQFSGKRVEILFNKIVQLDHPLDQIVVSPPQSKIPAAVSTGRRVTLTFNDSLKANTTYTIDFDSSIKDYNEGNVLKNFWTSFSTGSHVDSMEVAGYVLNARDLNPEPGILTGIYSNPADSAFTHFPMQRIGKSSDNGHFTIYGIKNGSYRVYALKDMDDDYKFSQPGEGIAFDPNIIHTSFKMDVRNDTIRKDSLTIDTIKRVPFVHYLPDSITLLYFKEDFFRQRLMKSERPTKDKLMLIFGAPNDTLPHLDPLGFRWQKAPLIQRSLHGDTLTYWLTDTIAEKVDSLHFVLHYTKSDSIGKLVPATDTLILHWHEINKGKKSKLALSKNEKNKKIKHDVIQLNSNILSTMEMDEPIRFNVDVPIVNVDSAKIHFYQKVDSLWKPVPFHFVKEDDVGLKFMLTYHYEPDEAFKLELDSAAFVDLHGLTNDKYVKTFKVRSLDEYSSLIIRLLKPLQHVVYELLDANDQVLRTQKASNAETTTIPYVMPGTYYLRLFIDANGNGKWDTGNFAKGREPETVYYFPEKIVLRVNWDIEEDWDPTAIPLYQQKPRALIKKATPQPLSESY
ncbi:MAG: Ig-like domain-containing protein [Microbacter sp.]